MIGRKRGETQNPPEAETEVQLEIGHVLFTDITSTARSTPRPSIAEGETAVNR